MCHGCCNLRGSPQRLVPRPELRPRCTGAKHLCWPAGMGLPGRLPAALQHVVPRLTARQDRRACCVLRAACSVLCRVPTLEGQVLGRLLGSRWSALLDRLLPELAGCLCGALKRHAGAHSRSWRLHAQTWGIQGSACAVRGPLNPQGAWALVQPQGAVHPPALFMCGHHDTCWLWAAARRRERALPLLCSLLKAVESLLAAPWWSSGMHGTAFA